MGRPLRIESSDVLYHVTSRGNEGQAIVRDKRDRERWTSYLERVVLRHRVVLYAYVLMDNHYHLFFRLQGPGLSRAIQTLNGAYTNYFNIRYKRMGHLFQGRFKSILIETEGHYLEVSRYIHMNPFRAGMVDRLSAYPWSSYPGYIRRSKAVDWLDYETILSEFRGSRRGVRKAYREFVEGRGATGTISPFDALVHGFLLGGGEFISTMKERFKGYDPDPAIPDLGKVIPRPSVALITEVVSSTFQCEKEDLVCRSRHNNDARKVGIYLARELGGKSLREIGTAFGGIKEAMVCHTAAGIRKRMAEDKRFCKRMEEIIEILHEN